MKSALTHLFSPILNFFDRGNEDFVYAKSHRKITLAVGFLFWVIAAGSLYLIIATKNMGALLPMLAFFSIGLVSLVIGFLGSDRAVAKIWGNK